MALTPIQLFALADAARDRGDYALAEQAYRALATNPDLELRTEARFRLGMMLADALHRYSDAGIEFRRILDEKPDATRVRLELARMDALLGRPGAAEREFRAAQAAGLPPDVERMVRFYAAALAARKRFGLSVEAALAPDTNINRATRSTTLNTIIGDFALDNNARSRSGVGLALGSQAYYRTGIDRRAGLLVQLDSQARLYRHSEFDDVIVALQAGPEYAWGANRLSLAATGSLRWYGKRLYSRSAGVSAIWQRAISKRTQLRAELGAASVDNRLNDLQDGASYRLALGVDRAFSARTGGGLRIEGSREAARDPGYATASGGISAYLFREFGPATVVLSGGYSRLEADARLLLYPRRRIDQRVNASLGSTLRRLRVGPFAPVARLRWERNFSTVGIYDYKRMAGELGLTAAF